MRAIERRLHPDAAWRYQFRAVTPESQCEWRDYLPDAEHDRDQIEDNA